ncbi:olfactory receptor 6B9-like [Pleurodeles waltl]|uniref:olfactory receptor 6B9-like n=1 Tax=Pleurodeles waltl TaxID=8319 RepID=UPI0037095E8C
MKGSNQTSIKEFILVGFPLARELELLLFVIFLFYYLLTIMANALIIAVIRVDGKLRKPMYYFLKHLAFMEMWYITVTVPKLLAMLLVQNRSISITGCITQLYFFMGLCCTECVLLAMMALDRFVAICKPLYYSTIMSERICLLLATVSWMCGFLISLVKVCYISRLTFCRSNVINHFFCDVSPLLNLSCTDMSLAELVDFILALFIQSAPLLVTVVSYACIVITILRMPTVTGRLKAFSTCASHLTVVVIFFGTTLFIYARPQRIDSFNSNKLVSMVYTIFTPLLNPLIYTLRNKEVKEALVRLLSRNRLFPKTTGSA